MKTSIAALSLIIVITIFSNGTTLPWDLESPFVHDNIPIGSDAACTTNAVGPGQFHVYITNCLSDTFQNCSLSVVSASFSAVIGHSSGWTSYPSLAPKDTQFFTLDLSMKSGVTSGQYPIDLKVLTTISGTVYTARIEGLNEVQESYTMPYATIKVDGNVRPNDWKNAFACEKFAAYQNCTVTDTANNSTTQSCATTPHFETRVRFCMDDTNLYVNMLFAYVMTWATRANDTISLFVATSKSATPVVVKLVGDASVVCSAGTAGIVSKIDTTRSKNYLTDGPLYSTSELCEAKIPRSTLGLSSVNQFYLNCIRKNSSSVEDGAETSYWRGRDINYSNPKYFPLFKIQPSGVVSSKVPEVKHSSKGTSRTILANPFNGWQSFSIAGSNQSLQRVAVYNLQGQLFKQVQTASNSSSSSLQQTIRQDSRKAGMGIFIMRIDNQ